MITPFPIPLIYYITPKRKSKGRFDFSNRPVFIELEFLIFQDIHRFAEALEVDNLALAQESDCVVDVGVVGEAKDVIVHRACLLLC